MNSQSARERAPRPETEPVDGKVCGPTSATLHVMARLRAATSAAHRRIELNPHLAALLSPDLTEAQYQDVLLRYHSYFTRVEPSLFVKLSTVIPTCELYTRRKIPLLEHDLAELGILPRLVEPAFPMGEMSIACALGRFYVHEGASLGGRLIHAALRRNERRLGSCRFFEGYGRESAEAWRRAQAILETGLNREPEIRKAAEAANATFHDIDRVMCGDHPCALGGAW